MRLTGESRRVLLIDEAVRWVRHPRDLYQAVIAFLAIGVVMVLAVFAQSTTLALTEDVHNAGGQLIETVLLLPMNLLEGILSFVLPLIILVDLIWHRRWRTLLTAVSSAGAAVGLAYVMRWVFTQYFPVSPITEELTSSLADQSLFPLLPYVAVIAALLTVSVGARAWKATSWGWPLLTISLVLSILKGNQSLPGALITVFLGILCGQLARYIAGDVPERATGARLITMIRRAGIDASQIVRVDQLPDDVALHAWHTTTTAPLGFVDRFGIDQIRQLLEKAEAGISGDASDGGSTSDVAQRVETGELPTVEDLRVFAQAEQSAAFDVDGSINPVSIRNELVRAWHPPLGSEASRNYLALTDDGTAYHVAVVDTDRQILGALSSAWNRLVLTTTTRRTENTIEETADRMALMAFAAADAGFAPHQSIRVASGDMSMLIAYKMEGSLALSALAPDSIPDSALDQLWDVLQAAHRQGLSHGNLTAETVALRDGHIQLLHWERGSVAASEMARRIDMAQALALIASRVGIDRAVASAGRRLPLDQILSLAPILQKAIIPARTLADFHERKELESLRDALATSVPETGEVELEQMRRFSMKTVFTVIVGIIAVYLLFVSINFEQLQQALSQARPLWIVAAFTISLLTYLGAAIMLKAYTAERLRLWDATLVQVSASLVGLVAPAGIGPAALNMRFLYKSRVKTPVAIATVSLVQVSQFVTTVMLLILLGLLTGEVGSFSIPSRTIFIVGASILVAVAAILFIRPLRRWIIRKIGPTITQIWPRLVWLGTHPGRILYGFVGSVLQIVGFTGAFGASLAAFGYELPIMTLAVTYLVSNTVGSMVPSPGGIGPVEAALTGGLTLARIPSSVAFSTAILYRLVTFWGRVPLGWVALRMCQRKGII